MSRCSEFASTRHDDEAFTLVETLVAFTILSIAMTALLAGVALSFKADRKAADTRETARLAQAVLDTIGVSEPLPAGGRSTGELPGGYSWTASSIIAAGPPILGVGGRWLEVTVTKTNRGAGAQTAVTLTTFRLEKEAPR